MSLTEEVLYLSPCSGNESICCEEESDWDKEKAKLQGRVRRVLLDELPISR